MNEPTRRPAYRQRVWRRKYYLCPAYRPQKQPQNA